MSGGVGLALLLPAILLSKNQLADDTRQGLHIHSVYVDSVSWPDAVAIRRRTRLGSAPD